VGPLLEGKIRDTKVILMKSSQWGFTESLEKRPGVERVRLTEGEGRQGDLRRSSRRGNNSKNRSNEKAGGGVLAAKVQQGEKAWEEKR